MSQNNQSFFIFFQCKCSLLRFETANFHICLTCLTMYCQGCCIAALCHFYAALFGLCSTTAGDVAMSSVGHAVIRRCFSQD